LNFQIKKKANELSVLCNVDVVVLLKNNKRVDSYCSNRVIKERLEPRLSYIFDHPVATRQKKVAASCNIVKGKKLQKFPPNSHGNVRIEYDDDTDSDKENNIA